MEKLSKRQKEVLTILTKYISKHGYAPSNRELAALMNLKSPSTVHEHLTKLQSKGFIKIVSVRAIQITEKGKLAHANN